MPEWKYPSHRQGLKVEDKEKIALENYRNRVKRKEDNNEICPLCRKRVLDFDSHFKDCTENPDSVTYEQFQKRNKNENEHRFIKLVDDFKEARNPTKKAKKTQSTKWKWRFRQRS